MIMAFLWGSSKPSKAEGISLDEIKWLQISLKQGLENVGLLECNSEALKAAVESQTYTAQKLQQELRSCNLQKVLTDKETQTEESNNSEDIGCPGDTRQSDRGRQGSQQVTNEDYLASDIHDEETESAVDPPSKQQEQHESTDDILVKLLLNNQNVLKNQAIVNEKGVQNNARWLQKLQQDVDGWFSQNFESSLNEQDKKYKALEEEKNLLSRKCKGLEDEKNQLSKKCKRLDEENNKLSEKCKEVEEGKKELHIEIEKLKKLCDKLSAENNYLKNPVKPTSYSSGSWFSYPPPPKKQVTTQVYCPRKSDLMTNVVSELSNTLQLQMSSYHLDLVIQMCDTPFNINRSLPVIVICLNASRLGTDVSNALQGVPTGPNVAVLILHHKDLHALPTQSSDRVLTGSEYKNIGAIIDMAYLTNKGMYTCDMNNRALETLKDFIQTHTHP
ncbi:hypothetical protein CHS0354_034605 [Potamilus streckersoni]|uniref:Uncharacterized protein n=1 Tax=Potamilus streckersoni TaxID=2493646 RepID=A0AAE0W0Y0_9BIVA|nr:hypothetical protein CHS0354_034605 [Potamilus streckersoni]